MKKIVLGAVLLALCGSAYASKADTYYTCTRKADNGFIIKNIQYVQGEGQSKYILLGETVQDRDIFFYNTLEDLKEGVYDSSQTATIRIASSKDVPLIVYYKTAIEEKEYHCEYDAAYSMVALDDWDKEHKPRDKKAEHQAMLSAKAKAEAAKIAAEKAAADKKAAASGVDDLLGDLSTGNNHPKATKPVSNGASGADVSQYASMIRAAIQSHLNTSEYVGKQCALTLHLNSDGTVKGVDGMEGDDSLCSAATAAIFKTRFPKPNSEAIYNIFKDAKLNLKF